MCFGILYDNVFTLSAVGSGDAGCARKATDLKNLTKALISWDYWVFFSDVWVQIGGLVWAVVA